MAVAVAEGRAVAVAEVALSSATVTVRIVRLLTFSHCRYCALDLAPPFAWTICNNSLTRGLRTYSSTSSEPTVLDPLQYLRCVCCTNRITNAAMLQLPTVKGPPLNPRQDTKSDTEAPEKDYDQGSPPSRVRFLAGERERDKNKLQPLQRAEPPARKRRRQ